MKVEKTTVFVLLAVAGILVFYLQAVPVFFGPGHLGWVSSHSLSIIRHATPQRMFLGFTCEFTGNPTYVYFDRYPILFSGSMHLLLQPFSSSFSEYIEWARRYMNVIYVLSIIVGYGIAMTLTKDRYVSLIATMFTFMGMFFVFYKDMIHFDQPAMLGVLVLFFAVCRYELHKDTRLLWVALTAVLIGRGYASNFLLLLWNILFVLDLLLKRSFSFRKYFTSVQFKACFIAGVLSIAALAFNIYSESVTRNIPWTETSIVKSAKFRLDLSGEHDDAKQTRLLSFTKDQVERTIGGFIPYGIYQYQGEESPRPDWLLIGSYFLVLFIFLVVSVLKTDVLKLFWKRRTLILLGIFSGYFWLFPLRNLAAFHNYTNMYNVLLYIIVYSTIFYCLKKRKGAIAVVAIASVLFALSLNSVRQTHLKYDLPENNINDDIDRIRHYLTANNIKNIYLPDGHRKLIEGSPYASCLYFSDFRIADEPDEAALTVTRDMKNQQELVPGTRLLHLYRNN